MTDNLEAILESIFAPCDLAPSHCSQSLNSESENEESANIVTAELPADIVTVLKGYVQRTGRSQSQVILEILCSMLGASPDSVEDLANDMAVDNGRANHSSAEIELLQTCFKQLDGMIQRMEMLEGKSIAF